MKFLLTIVVLTVGGGLASAQTSSSPAPPSGAQLTTLSGCVADVRTPRRIYTLADGLDGATYELKGLSVKDYVGRRVEIIGQRPKGLKVVGGLYPNANVAAQGGSIDPAKAAMAAQAGPTANQPKPTIEFTVKSVQVVAGDCPK
jgi:hypothetical protein